MGCKIVDVNNLHSYIKIINQYSKVKIVIQRADSLLYLLKSLESLLAVHESN